MERSIGAYKTTSIMLEVNAAGNIIIIDPGAYKSFATNLYLDLHVPFFFWGG